MSSIFQAKSIIEVLFLYFLIDIFSFVDHLVFFNVINLPGKVYNRSSILEHVYTEGRVTLDEKHNVTESHSGMGEKLIFHHLI